MTQWKISYWIPTNSINSVEFKLIAIKNEKRKKWNENIFGPGENWFCISLARNRTHRSRFDRSVKHLNHFIVRLFFFVDVDCVLGMPVSTVYCPTWHIRWHKPTVQKLLHFLRSTVNEKKIKSYDSIFINEKNSFKAWAVVIYELGWINSNKIFLHIDLFIRKVDPPKNQNSTRGILYRPLLKNRCTRKLYSSWSILIRIGR